LIMNIFFLSKVPRRAAEMHCDQHVVKMPIEAAQMLSVPHLQASGPKDVLLYGLSNPNHRCAVWVRQSRANYLWAYRYMVCLMEEYEYRYGRKHEVWDIEPLVRNIPDSIPNIGFTPPALAMPEFLRQDNYIKAYRDFYLYDKQFGRWTRRPPPDWWHHSDVRPDSLRQKRLREGKPRRKLPARISFRVSLIK
jgi:hypothetical protein